VQEAIVRFSEENATKTALLLTNALILDRPITVVRYDPTKDSSEHSGGEKPADSSQAPAQTGTTASTAPHPVTSKIASVIATGYTMGADALVKAKEYDESYQVSSSIKSSAEKVTAKAGEIDEAYKISETTKSWTSAAAEKLSQLDKSYGVSDTVSHIGTAASTTAKQVAQSEPVVATVGVIKQSGATIASYAGGVTSEAAKVLEYPTVKSAGETIKSTTAAVKTEFSTVVDEANKQIKQTQSTRNLEVAPPLDEGKEALLRIASNDSVSSAEGEEEDKGAVSEQPKTQGEAGK